jgi:plastocyanin
VSRLLWCVAFIAFVTGCGEPSAKESPAAPAVPKKAVDAASAGKITGTVALKGSPPAAKPLKMSGSSECTALHATPPADQSYVVKDGKLANVFVRVKDGLDAYEFKAPAQAVVLDQVGCLFVPRVFGVMVNQKVQLKNSDATLHNVHTFPNVNPVYNRGFPNKGSEQDTTFAQPETMIEIKCDVHSWMKGYVGVLEHPCYQVTKEDGAFTLEGVPPGKYVVEAWHEKLGTQEATVEVKPKEAATVSFTFEIK